MMSISVRLNITAETAVEIRKYHVFAVAAKRRRRQYPLFE